MIRWPCWCTKQWQNAAKVLHNNIIQFPKDLFRYFLFTPTWPPRRQVKTDNTLAMTCTRICLKCGWDFQFVDENLFEMFAALKVLQSVVDWTLKILSMLWVYHKQRMYLSCSLKLGIGNNTIHFSRSWKRVTLCDFFKMKNKTHTKSKLALRLESNF